MDNICRKRRFFKSFRQKFRYKNDLRNPSEKKSLRTLEVTEGFKCKDQINVLLDLDSFAALLSRLMGCFAKLQIAQTFSGIDRLAYENRFGVMLDKGLVDVGE